MKKKRSRRLLSSKFTLSALILAIVFCTTSILFWTKSGADKIGENSYPGWVACAPEKGRFTALFPSNPEYTSQDFTVSSQGKTLTYHEYMSFDDAKRPFIVSYLNFPRQWRLLGTNSLLKKTLSALVEKEPGAEVIYQKSVKHNGRHSALDFKLKKGEDIIHGKLIVIDATLYRLTVTAKETEEAAVEPFMHSFYYLGE